MKNPEQFIKILDIILKTNLTQEAAEQYEKLKKAAVEKLRNKK